MHFHEYLMSKSLVCGESETNCPTESRRGEDATGRRCSLEFSVKDSKNRLIRCAAERDKNLNVAFLGDDLR